MTRYTKLAISMPLRAADHVRRAVKAGEAPSVSAYIVAAVEEKAKKETWRDFIDELLEETGGPTTPAERKRAHQLLYGPLPHWKEQLAAKRAAKPRAARRPRR